MSIFVYLCKECYTLVITSYIYICYALFLSDRCFKFLVMRFLPMSQMNVRTVEQKSISYYERIVHYPYLNNILARLRFLETWLRKSRNYNDGTLILVIMISEIQR